MREVLTSSSNPKVKAAIRLRKSSGRKKSGRFLIDGVREATLAIQAGIEIEELFVPPEIQLPVALKESRAAYHVNDAVAAKISYGQRGADLVAVARTPSLEFEPPAWNPSDLILVLDECEKPGNIGACLRTAEACNAKVLLTDPICDPFNPNAIRASRGTVFSVPLAVTTVSELKDWCRQQAVKIYCATIDGQHRLWDINFRQGGCCIVFGNEAEGLAPGKWGFGTEGMETFSIPMQGQSVDSLNLSISAAVTLYEAVRQNSMGIE